MPAKIPKLPRQIVAVRGRRASMHPLARRLLSPGEGWLQA